MYIDQLKKQNQEPSTVDEEKTKVFRFSIITAATCLVLIIILQHGLIKPSSTNHGSAVLIQDILTVDCSKKNSYEQTKTRLPKSLIVEGSGEICDYFSLSNLGSMFDTPEGHTGITFLTNSEQEKQLKKIWLESLGINWQVIAQGKLKLFLGTLFDTNSRIPNLKLIDDFQDNPEGEIFGSGSKVGWQYEPGALFKLTRIPSEVTHRVLIESGFLYLILIPVLTLIVSLYRNRKLKIWMITGSTLPLLSAMEFSLISAWAYDVPRYLAPFNLWAILFSLLILFTQESKLPESGNHALTS
jgi:hypothetical protein